jgi:hypothetical protein
LSVTPFRATDEKPETSALGKVNWHGPVHISKLVPVVVVLVVVVDVVVVVEVDVVVEAGVVVVVVVVVGTTRRGRPASVMETDRTGVCPPLPFTKSVTFTNRRTVPRLPEMCAFATPVPEEHETFLCKAPPKVHELACRTRAVTTTVPPRWVR